jgi:hypothetical protein
MYKRMTIDLELSEKFEASLDKIFDKLGHTKMYNIHSNLDGTMRMERIAKCK